MTLRPQVTDRVALHLVHDTGEIRRIGQVTVRLDEALALDVRVFVALIQTLGVRRRRAPLDAMHFVALIEQELSKVATVLVCDASDGGFFHDEARESPNGA